MRRLIDDPDLREQPLEILEQKVSVFEEPKHAQIHANACDEPATSCMWISSFGHLTAKPKTDDDDEKNDERERIKEHGEAAIELPFRKRGACSSHIEADV